MMIQKRHLLLLIGLLLPATALAAEGAGSQLGVVYGLSVPDADNSNPHHIFGVKGAANLSPTFGLGGYYLDTHKQVGTGATPFDYSLHGVEAIFHMGGSNGDTFMSVRVGLSKVKTESNDVDVIFSPYHYGAAAGYDYFITSWLTMGFEGSFVVVEKSSTRKDSVTHELDSFGVINFLVSLQLRL